MLTERDLQILRALARYFVLSRPQIQRLCFPDDESGRVTRRRLQTLFDGQYLNRMRLLVQNPQAGSAASVYYPAKKGCEVLAEHFEDERLLLTPTQSPQSHHVYHWVAVSETHLALDAAISMQVQVRLESWINEWDVVNQAESAPEKRFRLYTLLRESPRLVCAPDAAFELSLGEHRKAFYIEQDRNTSGVKQVAASKTAGYAAMAERQTHRKHFPQTNVSTFSVLMLAPGARRRDALRKSMADKPGSQLWKFADVGDLAPEKFLFEPIFYPCQGEPRPLVKRSASDPSTSDTKSSD